MKKNLKLTALFLVSGYTIMAQDAVVSKLRDDAKVEIKKEDKQPEGWSTKGIFNVSLSQGAASNWSAGADKSTFSTNVLLNYQALYKSGKNFWDNNLTVNYGLMNTTSSGFRKNDDRFDFVSKYGHQLDTAGKWFFSIVGNFRTQLTDGRRYYKTTAGLDTSELTSSFMAPAYLLLSPGIEWRPTSSFNLFVSPVSSRWTIVSRNTGKLGTLYGLDPGKKSKYEIGGFLTANFNKEVFKNVIYVGRLDLFSNYRHNPQNVDVYWTNQIAMKVNKFLQVTYNFDLIYDDDARKPEGARWGTQIKSLLGVGFATTF